MVRRPARLIRQLVALALGVALWVVASEAKAAGGGTGGGTGAPMCDFHGASVNAPAPTLETPQSATEISATEISKAADSDPTAACDALPGLHTRLPGRFHHVTPREEAVPERQACDLPAIASLPPRACVRAGAFVKTAGARPGMRLALERPPRSV